MRAIGHAIWKFNWKYAATEFLIVAAGILAAFSWDSWWDRRRDESRTAGYLRQVVAELRESEANLERVTVDMRARVVAAAQLSRASFTATPPSETELRRWLLTNMFYETPDLTMGTVRAMVASGDINFIPDQALRTQISVIVDRVAGYENWMRAQITEWLLPAWHEMHPFARFASLQLELTPQDSVTARATRDSTYLLPSVARIQAFPVNLTRELRSPTFHDVMVDTYVARMDLLNTTEAILVDLTALRERIDHWLEGRR